MRDQTLPHETRRVLFLGPLACLIVFVGSCGGYNVNDVTLTISPAAATIPKSSQIALVASVNKFCAGCLPEIDWSIAENNGVNPCLWQAGQTPPPTGSCPGGTLQVQGFVNNTSVIYFSPSTAGTYHVTGWQVVSFTSGVKGTSVITVSP